MLILWEFVISCDNLENVVVSTQRDNKKKIEFKKAPIFRGFFNANF